MLRRAYMPTADWILAGLHVIGLTENLSIFYSFGINCSNILLVAFANMLKTLLSPLVTVPAEAIYLEEESATRSTMKSFTRAFGLSSGLLSFTPENILRGLAYWLNRLPAILLSSATISASLALFSAIELTLMWSRLEKSLTIRFPRDLVGASLLISDVLLSVTLLKSAVVGFPVLLFKDYLLESIESGEFKAISLPKNLAAVDSLTCIFESGEPRGAILKSDIP